MIQRHANDDLDKTRPDYESFNIREAPQSFWGGLWAFLKTRSITDVATFTTPFSLAYVAVQVVAATAPTLSGVLGCSFISVLIFAYGMAALVLSRNKKWDDQVKTSRQLGLILNSQSLLDRS